MNRDSAQIGEIEIRDSRIDDIAEISALVETCGPYLTKHPPYQYMIYTRYFSATCAVAIDSGIVVGWCSMLQFSRGEYFLPQLGIVPEARGKGIALGLFAYLLAKLRARHGDDFRIEFTVDRRNKTVHRLNRRVADRFGLWLQKLPEAVPPLGDGCDEELYELTPISAVNVKLSPAA